VWHKQDLFLEKTTTGRPQGVGVIVAADIGQSLKGTFNSTSVARVGFGTPKTLVYAIL